MQLTDSNHNEVDREASRRDKGIEVMPAETITIAAIGKWLIGLVLAPWLWYERKRVDKLEKIIAADHYTKKEVKEEIKDRTAPIREDMKEVKETMKSMLDQTSIIGLTVARIDERSKLKND